jgi:type II secretory pathway pseudopilin PulG
MAGRAVYRKFASAFGAEVAHDFLYGANELGVIDSKEIAPLFGDRTMVYSANVKEGKADALEDKAFSLRQQRDRQLDKIQQQARTVESAADAFIKQSQGAVTHNFQINQKALNKLTRSPKKQAAILAETFTQSQKYNQAIGAVRSSYQKTERRFNGLIDKANRQADAVRNLEGTSVRILGRDK